MNPSPSIVIVAPSVSETVAAREARPFAAACAPLRDAIRAAVAESAVLRTGVDAYPRPRPPTDLSEEGLKRHALAVQAAGSARHGAQMLRRRHGATIRPLLLALAFARGRTYARTEPRGKPNPETGKVPPLPVFLASDVTAALERAVTQQNGVEYRQRRTAALERAGAAGRDVTHYLPPVVAAPDVTTSRLRTAVMAWLAGK